MTPQSGQPHSARDDSAGEEQSAKVRDWSLLRRLFGLLRPYRRSVVCSVLCAIADMGLQILGPLVISIAVDQYFMSRTRISPFLGAWLPADRNAGMVRLSMVYLCILLTTFLVQSLQAFLAAWTGQKAMSDLRGRIFEHLQQLNVAFFDANPVGRLVTRVTTDVEALSELFSNGVVGLIANLVVVAFFLSSMLFLSSRLTMILAALLPLFLTLTVVFRRFVTPTQQRVRILIARINAMIAEHINGVAVLQLFNRQKTSADEFDSINQQHRTASKGWVTANSWFMPAVDLMGTISQASLILVGSWLLHDGQLSVGILVAFLQYGAKFLRPIQDVSERYSVLQAGIVSAERVFRLLDTKPPGGTRVAPADLVPAGTDIEFDHVWFAYQGDNWVLRDVSFRIAEGESIAVVGHTGAGKTTLINLLLRFYEPQKGAIRLGGVDIRTRSVESLRRQFGIVLQDTYVHEGSILANIEFGLENAAKDAAREAARCVGLAEVAETLPDGLDTHVAERGDNLSAGQKQLVGFARALCRNARLLLLDEATSDIDMETESGIQRALGSLLSGRTSITIAHRLSTVLSVDRIVVMHRGAVRELGTHGELLAQRGLYWRLHQLQFGSPEYGRSESAMEQQAAAVKLAAPLGGAA